MGGAGKNFLSAVTGQFKACRDALRSDLAAVGADVVVQKGSQQHGGTLLQKLEEYIASCDRVIALVDNAYGWQPEPAALSDNAQTRSYTQWEYYFARGERLDGTQAIAKPIYLYLASPSYLEQNPVEQADAEARQQKDFVDEMRSERVAKTKMSLTASITWHGWCCVMAFACRPRQT